MGTNLLKAINRIVDYHTTNLQDYDTTYDIGINSEGEPLEFFIKDSLAGTLHMKDKEQKEEIFSREFSWLGNQNNPPDIIVTKGDAYEIKKSKSLSANVQLNSSPPKDMLHSGDSRLASACKECDGGKWMEKDIFYVMGQVVNHRIVNLFFIHGRCYAARPETYSKLASTITEAVISADLEFNATNELGRVNRIDPLGITDLRIRGMWQIQHPIKIFSNFYQPNKSQFGLATILLKEKYYSYPLSDRQNIELNQKILFTEIQIKDPNNPAQRKDAILLRLTSGSLL